MQLQHKHPNAALHSFTTQMTVLYTAVLELQMLFETISTTLDTAGSFPRLCAKQRPPAAQTTSDVALVACCLQASALARLFKPMVEWYAGRYQANLAVSLKKYGLRYDDLYDPRMDLVSHQGLGSCVCCGWWVGTMICRGRRRRERTAADE